MRNPLSHRGTLTSPPGGAWLRRGNRPGERGDSTTVPIPTDVDEALLRWERERPPELADDPLLFPRLGRPRRDSAFPDAGGKLSGQALSDIVKPIMLAAGVPAELAHPHVLRHTYGSLFIRNGGELSKLQALMGHASSETTSLYVHHTREGLEAAVSANESGRSLLEAHADRRRRRASSAD